MILNPATASSDKPPLPLHFVTPKTLKTTLAALPEPAQNYARDQGFLGKADQLCLYPREDGSIAGALFGMEPGASEAETSFALAAVRACLPAKSFALQTPLAAPEQFALAWMMDAYQFSLDPEEPQASASLMLPEAVNLDEVHALAEGVAFGRDLINKPANLLGTDELCQAVRDLGAANQAKVTITQGESLEKEFPLLAAVGAGSARPPAMIDLRWGENHHPCLALVGKGIVFDTGGLDIKPSSNMLLMKKDMGGSAAVLALAKMIMARELPINLRVLVPTAENAIGSRAFRPSDVIRSRKGLTVEVGNTDAEGRLVLADALALAMEEKPDLTIDMATLTGAARVALGPAIPPFFCHDDDFADALMEASRETGDPLWRLPLWQPYAKGLSSRIASTNSITSGGFAGAITPALFLEKFVTPGAAWAHFDLYGWNPAASPGRPQGGEVQAVRALFHYLKSWCQNAPAKP